MHLETIESTVDGRILDLACPAIFKCLLSSFFYVLLAENNQRHQNKMKSCLIYSSENAQRSHTLK